MSAAKKIVLNVGSDNTPPPAVHSAEANRTTIDLEGFQQTVDRMVEAAELKNMAEAEIAEHRRLLDAAATQARLDAEKRGQFAKTIYARGEKHTVTYAFPNSFAKIDVGSEPQLRSALGDLLYTRLFRRKKAAKVRPEKLEALLNFLGDRAAEFLEVDECIETVEEFRERRFELRSTLDEAQNATLDNLISQVSQKPTLKFK